MPKMARQEEPRLRTKVVRGPRAQALPLSAFPAAQIGRGIGELGKGVSQLADRITTTEAEEALVKFERTYNDFFFNPESGYFNTQGRVAYDTADNANESLQKLAKEHADTMSNPQAREKFMSVANSHITRGQLDIMRHSAKGLQAWEISTIKAQVENTIENAALYRTDDKRLSVQRELGRQAIYDAAALEGVTGDALNERLQTYESAFASATIDAAILDNAAEGQLALDKYGDRLEGAEKVKFENRILNKAAAEKTQLDSQNAVMLANNIVATHGSNRSAVLDALTKIKDPETQQKARKDAMYHVNQLKEAEAEERADIYEASESFVMQNGSVEALKAAYPDQWNKLSPKQQRQLEKGEPVVNDWNTWHNFMSMSDEEIRKMKPSEVERIALKLDKSHRDKLYNMWRESRDPKTTPSAESQVGRTLSAQTKSAVEQIMGKKSRKWNSRDLSRADQFYALIDSETKFKAATLDRDLTSEEYTNLLNSLTRKVIIEKDFWPDPELGISDIPEEHFGDLIKALRDHRIPITSDTLIRAYEQAK
jgi:hypothetical protein